MDQLDPTATVAATLLQLGQASDLYRYPKSTKTDLISMGRDKGITVKPIDRNSTGDEYILAHVAPDRAGANSWTVRTLAAHARFLGLVTHEGEHVWVNVANLEVGAGGSQIYEIAANYAFNNGLVFIGDPAGVTEAAKRRRLEHMLSSAVKYGTTDHLEPHIDQIGGNPTEGIAPLNWTPKDTLANINAMVDASIATTLAAVPALNSITYDVKACQFQANDGSKLEPGDFASLLLQGGLRAAGGPGHTTLQRAALFRTLLQGSDARRAVLDAVREQQGTRGAGFGGSFY